MADNAQVHEQAIQTHLGILQGVIERMAGNSASAKAWCITLVSAILVIVAEKHQPRFVWLAFIPTLLFLALDTYYLALEKGYRQAYNRFVEQLHRGTISEAAFYAVRHEGKMSRHVGEALVSFGVLPFYAMLIVMILLAQRLVI